MSKPTKRPTPKAATKTKVNIVQPQEMKKSFSPKPKIGLLSMLTPYLPGLLLFFIALVIALLTYKDYGMAWDEQIQRFVGTSSYDYAFNNDPTLKTIEYRDLGAGFELPLVFIEKMFNLNDSQEIYQMRHLVTHIFFLLSALCGYVLAYRLFKNKLIACLGFILLAFHPRIYAHSYFNTKDIPFLSVFIIVFLLCQVAFEKNKPFWYFILGLGCGYATSIREMGILFVPIIGSFFLIDLLRSRYLKERLQPVIKHFALFIIGFCALLYIAWPILWSNPIFYFIEEFKRLSHINWSGGVLFAGRCVRSDMLPWYYVPVWFCITMPELWLLAGLVGFVWAIVAFAMKPMKFLLNTPERNYLLYIACFIGPVITITALNSINYDDWRHLYFIYPAFVMLILFVVNKIAVGKKELIVGILFSIQIAYIGFFMVKYHPFQQVYFNNFVSHEPEYLRKHYDMDYWGCSFKQGLEHLLEKNKSRSIKIAGELRAIVDNNSLLLSEADRRRIQFTDLDDADYLITNFRDHPYDYPNYATDYSIKVLNSSILSIFKIEKDSASVLRRMNEENTILSNFLAGNAHQSYAKAVAINNVANLTFARKKYAQAAELYEEAIVLNPGYVNLYTNTAICHYYLNKFDSSIFYLNRAIGVDSTFNASYEDLAYTYRAQNKLDSAKKYERIAQKSNSGFKIKY